MPRTARTVIPNVPHHVIQRGNRRQDVFFNELDYLFYLSLLKEKTEQAGTTILAYCLMPNHVHLILRPQDENGLRVIGEVHRVYTRKINEKMNWTGFLWQGRFASYPMGEAYFYNALRYVELNPVWARFCETPDSYRWSSARQRVQPSKTITDLRVEPAKNMVKDWHAYWNEGLMLHDMRMEIANNEISCKPQISIPEKTKATGTR